jgi:flagellar L-ring protein FlgH
MSARRMAATGLMAAGACLAAPACAESLYAETQYRPLTSDNRAFRAGDALTVQVFENSSANTSVSTGTQRKNGASMSLTHRAAQPTAQAGLSVGGEFDGGGRTQRANKLLATLTVTVRSLLPNGDLMVAGEQLLNINDELQKVTLEGRVRQIDISDSNVVLSTRLADARIHYVGEGDVSDRSRRSWWRRLLDAFGL